MSNPVALHREKVHVLVASHRELVAAGPNRIDCGVLHERAPRRHQRGPVVVHRNKKDDRSDAE
jgi:hypothetical protein